MSLFSFKRLPSEPGSFDPAPATPEAEPAGFRPGKGSVPRRLSCGVVLLNRQRELLLCHVTGQNHWDLPKGGMDAGETPLQAALRETREETGLGLDRDTLHDLGRLAYTHKKDLHLYAALVPRFDVSRLRCESLFADRITGRTLPEMDGYRWVDLPDAGTLCTPKMALVLERLDLGSMLDRLTALQPAEPAR